MKDYYFKRLKEISFFNSQLKTLVLFSLSLMSLKISFAQVQIFPGETNLEVICKELVIGDLGLQLE